ncbi:protein PSK SIMULATOR 1-like [Wolffia australiana]
MAVGSSAGPKAWLAPLFQRFHEESDPQLLGILAFEVGRTMSLLVRLHHGLSEPGIRRLFSCTLSTEGVVYLNSANKRSLLRHACAEMVDDLDTAAATIARLGRRCGGLWPFGFDDLYAELQSGSENLVHLNLGFSPKEVDKKVQRMEKYVATTSKLFNAMEDLSKLEAKNTDHSPDSLRKQLNQMRNKVRQLREESLWSRRFDKVSELLARSLVSIFVRLNAVFRPFVPELPLVSLDRQGRLKVFSSYSARQCYSTHQDKNNGGIYSSGPLERTTPGNLQLRSSGPILLSTPKNDVEEKSWKDIALQPPENTLGATGMALRYAEVVVFVEKLVSSPAFVAEETRKELYQKLPKGLRGVVMAKLRNHLKLDDKESRSDELAVGWREAVEGILRWLGPIAKDTLQWQLERSLKNREMSWDVKVFAVQTMMFSDREKVEAAIAELLVAFSHVCRHS